MGGSGVRWGRDSSEGLLNRTHLLNLPCHSARTMLMGIYPERVTKYHHLCGTHLLNLPRHSVSTMVMGIYPERVMNTMTAIQGCRAIAM